MGLQPLEHFAGGFAEPEVAPFIDGAKVFAEGAELIGVHHVDRQLIINHDTPEEFVAMDVFKENIQELVVRGSQLHIDERGTARLHAGIKSHMGFYHNLGKFAGVHPVGAVERVGRAAVGGVELVGNGNRENLLFHVKHLSFEYALLYHVHPGFTSDLVTFLQLFLKKIFAIICHYTNVK